MKIRILCGIALAATGLMGTRVIAQASPSSPPPVVAPGADVPASGIFYARGVNPVSIAPDRNIGQLGSNGIQYHGGPLLTSGPDVHYIYYGSWSQNDQSILNNFAQSDGGSPYFAINTTYYNGQSIHVLNHVTFSGAVNTGETLGNSLSDANILTIVKNQNPTDTNGVYFVLTSPDVNETSGLDTQYCGWHDHATINGRDIKYAFVGNPARDLSACSNGTPSPNSDPGADAAASIIAHELEEATTDPDLNAWYDRSGNENADKCAWTFGSTYKTKNGGVANVNLGGVDYLIQQNWLNASGGRCTMHYP